MLATVKLLSSSALFLSTTTTSITFYTNSCNGSNTKSIKNQGSAYLILGNDRVHAGIEVNVQASNHYMVSPHISIHNQTIQTTSINHTTLWIKLSLCTHKSTQFLFSSASSGSRSWSNRTKGGQSSIEICGSCSSDSSPLLASNGSSSSGSGPCCNLLWKHLHAASCV